MDRELIYKYRYFDKDGYHLRLLSHGELHFASPSSFNDPFDCALPLRLDLLTPEQAIPLYAEEVQRREPGASDEEARRIATVALEREGDYSLADLQELAEVGRKRMNDLFRVCALSGNPGNLLMWSHYSDQHQGFCIGFDWDELASSLEMGERVGGFHVCYSDGMPVLNPAEMAYRDIVLQSLKTKYDLWRYEDEYRLYCSADIPAQHILPPGVIAEVTMGCEIQPEERDMLIEALRTRGDMSVELYQATKQVERFALTRHPVQY